MNEKSKNMTPEEKAIFDQGKRDAADAYKVRKNAARAIIMSWIPEAKITDEVKQAILYLSGQGVRTSRSGVNDELKAFLVEPKTALEIYNEFEFGKPTMDQKIRQFIKADQKVWIAFDEDSKTYSIAGKGDNPPRNWTGYLPVEKVEL